MTDLCAYQGEPGAFSEEAARRLVGAAVPLLPCADFPAMFAAIEGAEARWAVLPVENTLAGAVSECQGWLEQARVKQIGALRLPIRLALIAPAGVVLAEVQRVYSHPMALRQCRNFFGAHPWMSAVPARDTAGAVRELLERRQRDAAAIAGAHCAQLYGARVLADDIGDSRENYTRFVLVSQL